MTPEESKDFVAQFLAKRAEMSEEMRKKCAIDAENQLRDAAEEHFQHAWTEMLDDITKRVMADVASGMQLACAPQQQPFVAPAENKAYTGVKDWLAKIHTGESVCHFGEYPRRMSILGGEIKPMLIDSPLKINKRDITLIRRCLRKMKRDIVKARQKRMRHHTKQVKRACR